MSKIRDLSSNLCHAEMAFIMLSRHNPMGEKQEEPKYEDPVLLRCANSPYMLNLCSKGGKIIN